MGQNKRLVNIAGFFVLSTSMLASLILSGCGGEAGGIGGSGGGGESLSLVAYSTPREAYEEIIPAFEETDAGSGVTQYAILDTHPRRSP